MKKFLASLYLSGRFFWLWSGLITLFIFAFLLPALLPVAQLLFILLLAVGLVDGQLLYRPEQTVRAERHLPPLLSLGDQNRIRVRLTNTGQQRLHLRLIDELPIQFQIRDFEKALTMGPREEKGIQYELRPTERGDYAFGDLQLFVRSRIGLVERRITVPQAAKVSVYPSVVQMKQIELLAFDRLSFFQGVKKIRRIGHSYEFEQIKNYVRGDDYRSINWKASSRRGTLMVNQYEDERAQQVYSIIDKSRVMRMPFAGLSLMDYAINTSLAISNVALQKHDRAGLITFSDKLGASVKADSRPIQLNKILGALYKEKERPYEANYELLYFVTRKLITGRSLILLYTNFESTYALERVLPILRRINRLHLLVVIFFENTEIREFVEQPATTMEGIYQNTVARNFLAEKSQMVQKLRQYGIQAILTPPADLSVNTLNKYLELKSRGLI